MTLPNQEGPEDDTPGEIQIVVRQGIRLDANGQPPRGLWAARVDDRLLAEMLGICKGLLADGIVNDAETVALAQWINSHPDVAVGFPGNLVVERLNTIFEDGVVDEDEREDLKATLESLVGEPEGGSEDQNRSTTAVFNDPLPDVFFDGKLFCFTGRFAYGPRKRCEQAVIDRGGRVLPYVRRDTSYVVLGTFASDAWLYPTHGTKLMDALNLRLEERRVSIIPEKHWVEAVRYDNQ